MLLFRVICAVLMAWAVNFVLSRPEAQGLLGAVPEMGTIGPLAAAIVGFVNLSSRQGWGIVVAVANGVWAGVLSVITSGVLYLCYVAALGTMQGSIKNFESFLRVTGSETSDLFDLVVDIPLLVLTITATAILGVLTELLHWTLVRLRRNKQDPSETPY